MDNFDKFYDLGDYRFYLRRKGSAVTASRVPLVRPNMVDPSVPEEVLTYEELPDNLGSIFRTLENGGIPPIIQKELIGVSAR